MQKFTLTALFFLLIKIGFAQTNVTGTISSNTSWTLAGSPYVVTGNIIVSNGFTLTVDSGVQVKFNAARALTILGGIVATDATFTSNVASPVEGSWGKITIGSASQVATATLTRCEIEYATEALLVLNGNLVMNETNVSLSTNYAVSTQAATFASINIDGGTFNTTGANSGGVKININSTAQINRTNISTEGVYAIYSASATQVSINKLIANKGIFVYGNDPAVTSIDSSIISNNFNSADAIGIYGDHGANLQVYNTELLNCRVGIAGTDAEVKIKNVNIHNCTEYPIRMDGPMNIINEGNNIFSSNTNNSVYVLGTEFNQDVRLPNLGIPYLKNVGLLKVYRTFKLDIDSGVVFKLKDIAIAVYGELEANYVSFTSAAASPAAGNWQFFTIGNNTGADTATGLAVFNHCTISYASVGISMSRGSVYLESTNISDVATWAIGGENGNIHINGGTFHNLPSGGLYMVQNMTAAINGLTISNSVNPPNDYSLLSYSGSSFTIKNSNFSGGVRLEPGTLNSSIDSSVIKNIGGYALGINCSSTLNVSNSEISNCTVGIWGYAGSMHIQNLNIHDCTSVPIRYDGPMNLTVTEPNVFSSNGNNIAWFNFTELNQSMTLPKLPFPYVFSNYLNVQSAGRFIITSENILKFPDYTGLNIYGSLRAISNPNTKIYFTSTKDDNLGGDTNQDGTGTAPGASANWYGITFFNSSIDSLGILRRCLIRYANTGSSAGVITENASPTVDLCEFTNNYFGIKLLGVSKPVLTNNSIGSSTLTPIAMAFEADPVFNNNSFSFSDNTFDAIGLIGGTLVANATLKVRSVTNIPNVTYVMLEQITVPVTRTLTINKGIVIKSPDYGKYIRVQGKLNINGTADSLVTITSTRDDNAGNPFDTNKDGNGTVPARTDFGGIIFEPGSDNASLISYCHIRYTTGYYYNNYYYSQYIRNGAVTCVNSSPSISHCEFKEIEIGIVAAFSSNPTIADCSFVNTGSTPIAMAVSSNPAISNITFTSPRYAALGLLGGNVVANGAVAKRDVAGYTNITYVLLDNLKVTNGTTLTINPGIVIKLPGTRIEVEGALKINGNIAEKVILTSISDDNVGSPFDTNGDGNGTLPSKGNWYDIYFHPNSDDTASFINYAELRFGGGYYTGVLSFESASPTISNTLITEISGYGLVFTGNSQAVVGTTTISNCSQDPIALSIFSDPQLGNGIVFTANASNGLRILEGNIGSDAVLRKRNVAGINNIAYIIQSITITPGGKLTVEPGVVMKFLNYYSGITVNGVLSLIGASSEKIVLTSISDDSAGGDTNNNGNGSVPQPGNWAGILINSSSSLNKIKFADLRYLGGYPLSYYNQSNYVAISVVNGYYSIDSSEIKLGYGNVFGIYGSSHPDIRNCEVNGFLSGSPVNMSMFSNPTFGTLNFQNMKYMAIEIVPETYSQTATFPFRSLAGIDSITYLMNGAYYVNSGTTITIPAGMIFKRVGTAYFEVNGQLQVAGTKTNPIIFTDYRDDVYGNPKDMNLDGPSTKPDALTGTWISFNDVSNDSSKVEHVIFRDGATNYHYYYYSGSNFIAIGSSSPTIKNVKFEKGGIGLYVSGVSSPIIDSCIFDDLASVPFYTSVIAYPASTNGNMLKGRTVRGIAIIPETLVQDVTLPKRSFAGIANIPYIMNNFTVGSGATLTIAPGVVMKFFAYASGINVQKGLIAVGGSSPDSNIVFTSLNDDFYGGDTDADSTSNSRYNAPWYGITFENIALDNICKLDNVITRNTYYAVRTNSASPTITHCNISRNYYDAIAAYGASNPVINNCDFTEIYNGYAVNNVDKTFVINAENNWWGNNSGPTHSTNPAGKGFAVSDMVDFTPWVTTGAEVPLMGDVSLNGKVQAYDASLVLQNVVSSLILTTKQETVADVTANGSISAMDASLILQYASGIINKFPAEEYLKVQPSTESFAGLTIGTANALPGEEVVIPLYISGAEAMIGSEVQLKFDPGLLSVVAIESGDWTQLTELHNSDQQQGVLRLALSGTEEISGDGVLAYVRFKIADQVTGTVQAELALSKFMANESNQTAFSSNGFIAISGTTGTVQHNLDEGLKYIYPNPFRDETVIPFVVTENTTVVIEVYNRLGKKVNTLTEQVYPTGSYTLKWNGTDQNGEALSSGYYFISMKTGDKAQVRKVVLSR